MLELIDIIPSSFQGVPPCGRKWLGG